MTTIELEPKFSIAGMPGKCLKCTARGKLGSYLRKLLRGGKNAVLISEYEVKVRLYAEGKGLRYYELE